MDKEPDGTREFEMRREPSSKGDGDEKGKGDGELETNCDRGVVGNIRPLSSSSLTEGDVMEGDGELVGTGVGINL